MNQEASSLLVPQPRQVKALAIGWMLPLNLQLMLIGEDDQGVPDQGVPPVSGALLDEDLQAESFLRRYTTGQLAEYGVQPQWTEGESSADIVFQLENKTRTGARTQAYCLVIHEEGVVISASYPAGLFYGFVTFLQWLRIHGPEVGQSLAGVLIEDVPDFAERGVMLDISRNKVPTLSTLFDLIDLLAYLKINQFQLYMEHTFAYSGHETVWRDFSPLTGEEIQQLDAYCRQRFIDLVPNQNSFGHWHRWLVHEPYRSLAECPDGIEHPFSDVPEPFSLCPIDPGSDALLADLYNQLLPHFKSGLFNVGLDETLDLGKGRSAEVCRLRGQAQVYLDFLQRVHQLVSQHGRRMMIWGDIVLEHPELISQLPPDVIALCWGYEPDHPFATQCGELAASGLEFYVCPGTGSWSSLGGRVQDALLNIASAAVHGYAAGARGLLLTDWGDHGHLQPLPVSYPGFLAGAAFSWRVASADEPLDLPLAQLLDLHVLGAAAQPSPGRLLVELGNAYLNTGAPPPGSPGINGSALFFQLLFAQKPVELRRGTGMTVQHLEETQHYLESLIAELDRVDDDHELVRRELHWAGRMLLLACRLAIARKEQGEEVTLDRLVIAEELALVFEAQADVLREIWLARNRPGGLELSVAKVQRLANLCRGLHDC